MFTEWQSERCDMTCWPQERKWDMKRAPGVGGYIFAPEMDHLSFANHIFSGKNFWWFSLNHLVFWCKDGPKMDPSGAEPQPANVPSTSETLALTKTKYVEQNPRKSERKSQDARNKTYQNHMAMDQYLLIPFLVGWTSIYQLFWCSPGVQGFDPSPYHQQKWWSLAMANLEKSWEIHHQMGYRSTMG